MNLHFTYQVLCVHHIMPYSVLCNYHSMHIKPFSIYCILAFHVCVFGGVGQ